MKRFKLNSFSAFLNTRTLNVIEYYENVYFEIKLRKLINQTLKKNNFNTYKFSNHDITYRDDWEKANETYLTQKEDF